MCGLIWIPFRTSHTHAQYYAFTLAVRNTQQGSMGEGGSCAGPRVDLPLHSYLLLGHKGAPWRAASGRKARRRMSQLELHREEDSRLSPMTTLSSMNTIYAAGSLFSNRPPQSLFFASRSCHIHRDPSCLLCSASSFSFSPSLFLQPKSREMLSKHCKLIMALNIYYMMAGGLHGWMWEWGSVLGGERYAGSSSGSSLWSHTLSVSGERLLCTCFTGELLEN